MKTIKRWIKKMVKSIGNKKDYEEMDKLLLTAKLNYCFEHGITLKEMNAQVKKAIKGGGKK